MNNATTIKRILACGFLLTCLGTGWAQIPIEISIGHRSYYYQHAFAVKFKAAKPFGFFHTSSVLIPYNKNRINEIMSQSYVSYALTNCWTAGVGSIFTPVNRVRPSIFLQYFFKGKNTAVLVYPRADLWKDPNLELMGFVEHRGAIGHHLNMYARLQYMTTWSFEEHKRSYQYLRIGINLGEVQLGPAVNFDQYGKLAETYNSIGMFVRKEF